MRKIDRQLLNRPRRLRLSLLVVILVALWLLFALTTRFDVGASALVSLGCCVGPGAVLLLRGF